MSSVTRTPGVGVCLLDAKSNQKDLNFIVNLVKNNYIKSVIYERSPLDKVGKGTCNDLLSLRNHGLHACNGRSIHIFRECVLAPYWICCWHLFDF